MTAPPADDDRLYPKQMRAAEEELLAARRASCRLGAGNLIGVACSGGGIRSATVCLGFFQALAKWGGLPKVDYISTISGGGYFGAFLGSLYLQLGKAIKVEPGKAAQPTVNEVSRILADVQSAPIRWLRRHGRYIAPNGPADYANIAAIYIRNWAAVHFTIALAILPLAMVMIVVRAILANVLPELSALPAADPWWWPSLYWYFVPAIFVVTTAPMAIAYWLTQYGGTNSRLSAFGRLNRNYPLLGLGTIFTMGVLLLVGIRTFAANAGIETWGAITAVGICGLALVYWLLAEWNARVREQESATAFGDPELGPHQSMVRNLVSDWLAQSLKVLLVAVAISALDSAAESVYQRLFSNASLWSTIWSIAILITPFAHRVAPWLGKSLKATQGISLWSLLQTLGYVLCALVILGWATLAYAIVFRAGLVDWFGLVERRYWIAGWLICLAFLDLLTGRTMTLLNLSSLQSFYSGRLRRAYLGAANPSRLLRTRRQYAAGADTKTLNAGRPALEQSIRRDVRGDDRDWQSYKPHEFGGPLHLIGVTVNHTVNGGSDLELRDRKGFLMTVGPCAISASSCSHALYAGEALVPLLTTVDEWHFGKVRFNPERLTLSRWVAISGAAFSTGLGTRTKTGISILLALANVRLGYWWTANEMRVGGIQKWFGAQLRLFDEALGRFAGYRPPLWYLTDGGHSENTGAFELIRRQLPVIVILDNGADASYKFEDFGNLVRRVRLDLNAEIRECNLGDRKRLTNGADVESLVGGLTDLAPGTGGNQRESRRSIAMFEVIYQSAPSSLLILVKPTLVGDEPADVKHYATEHPAFPQEPTSDQFFDEAQWESYRRLGEHIGGRLLQRYSLSR